MTSSSQGASPKTSPCSAARAATPSGSSGPSEASSVTPQKKCSNPAGLMISIIRAGVRAAFHMVCVSPRGLVMYPPAASTTSRSPERNPISPSVTMEYSSSRVCMWGGTHAPTGNGCSTTDTCPLVLTEELEDDTDRAELACLALAWVEDGQLRLLDTAHRAHSPTF